ncbi:hypothetical protein FACS1894178_4490 [Bacteroidia bacterium]|nr:hypothetical protein FACS1894178_4490 [Bacteroidia bacterium]
MSIIIFSDKNDHTTTYIMQWIKYYGEEVKRINFPDTNFKIISLAETAKIYTSYGIIELTKNDFCWFRRAKLYDLVSPYSTSDEDCFYASEKIETLYALYNWIMDNCGYWANPFASQPSKLHLLYIAQKYGFLTPDTIFSSKKEDIINMFAKHEKLAVKPFTGLMKFEKDSFSTTLTTLLQKEDLDKIPEAFGGLIIQQYIEKKYELRSFFIESQFYTMAIFSQNDDKTKIDFRNYNKEKPNKNVVFVLPEEYKNKLLLIAKNANIDTGSFDILVDNDDNYYFLEVNPIGQFGMVSYPCNYYIEQQIAELLIAKHNGISKRKT